MGPPARRNPGGPLPALEPYPSPPRPVRDGTPKPQVPLLGASLHPHERSDKHVPDRPRARAWLGLLPLRRPRLSRRDDTEGERLLPLRQARTSSPATDVCLTRTP